MSDIVSIVPFSAAPLHVRRIDALLAPGGLAAHEIAVGQAEVGPSTVALHWPTDDDGQCIAGLLALELWEEAVRLPEDGGEARPDLDDRAQAIARVVLVLRQAGDGAGIELDPQIQRLFDPEAVRGDGAAVDLDLVVRGAGDDPILIRRLDGIPLVGDPSWDDADAGWELGLRVAFVQPTDPPAVIEAGTYRQPPWWITAPAAGRVTLPVVRQWPVRFVARDGGRSRPVEGQYVLATHLREQIVAGTREVSLEPRLLWLSGGTGEAVVVRAEVEPIPAAADEPPWAWRWGHVLPEEVPALAPWREAAEVLVRRGAPSDEVYRAPAMGPVIFHLLGPVVPAIEETDDSMPGARLRAAEGSARVLLDRSSITEGVIEIDFDDPWQSYLEDLRVILHEVDQARAMLILYQDFYREHRLELEAYTRLVQPLVRGLGHVELQARNNMWLGRSAVTLEQLQSGPQTVASESKLEVLRAITEAITESFSRAWEVFITDRFQAVFESKRYLSQGRAVVVAGRRRRLYEGGGGPDRHALGVDVDALVVEIPPRDQHYDDTMKCEIVSALAGLYSQQSELRSSAPGVLSGDWRPDQAEPWDGTVTLDHVWGQPSFGGTFPAPSGTIAEGRLLDARRVELLWSRLSGLMVQFGRAHLTLSQDQRVLEGHWWHGAYPTYEDARQGLDDAQHGAVRLERVGAVPSEPRIPVTPSARRDRFRRWLERPLRSLLEAQRERPEPSWRDSVAAGVPYFLASRLPKLRFWETLAGGGWNLFMYGGVSRRSLSTFLMGQADPEALGHLQGRSVWSLDKDEVKQLATAIARRADGSDHVDASIEPGLRHRLAGDLLGSIEITLSWIKLIADIDKQLGRKLSDYEISDVIAVVDAVAGSLEALGKSVQLVRPTWFEASGLKTPLGRGLAAVEKAGKVVATIDNLRSIVGEIIDGFEGRLVDVGRIVFAVLDIAALGVTIAAPVVGHVLGAILLLVQGLVGLLSMSGPEELAAWYCRTQWGHDLWHDYEEAEGSLHVVRKEDYRGVFIAAVDALNAFLDDVSGAVPSERKREVGRELQRFIDAYVQANVQLLNSSFLRDTVAGELSWSTEGSDPREAVLVYHVSEGADVVTDGTR